jgi:hypothetical protein
MIRTSEQQAAATPTNGDVPFSVFVAKHLQITPAYKDVMGTAITTPAPSTPAASTPAAPTVRDYG